MSVKKSHESRRAFAGVIEESCHFPAKYSTLSRKRRFILRKCRVFSVRLRPGLGRVAIGPLIRGTCATCGVTFPIVLELLGRHFQHYRESEASCGESAVFYRSDGPRVGPGRHRTDKTRHFRHMRPHFPDSVGTSGETFPTLSRK